MHPFYHDTRYSQQPYCWNMQTEPTIENFQNRSSYGWQNMSYGGWNQSQFNYSGPIPHYGRGFQNGGGRYLPHQTAGSTNAVVAPPERQPLPAAAQCTRSHLVGSGEGRCTQPLPPAFCKICGVRLSSYKIIEQHNNGKRHRRMLKLHEKSEKQRAINRQERGQMPNSPMNLVVQPKTVQKSKRNGYLVENVSSETTVDGHKNYLRKDIGETSKVPAEKLEGELGDDFVAEGHGSKRKVRGTRGGEYKNKNKRIRRAIESSKPDVNDLSNCVESLVQVPAVAPPQRPSALQELSPAPAVRSSFEPQIQLVLQPEFEHQVSEAIAHYESQKPMDETNVQLPSSVSVEFDSPLDSSTNTEISNGSFKAEEKMDVLITELRIALISQVNVCLKCGDQGFQETLVFCNKCQIYALHRYCLDGPVIFVDDVTWFCEDCEPKVVEKSSNDQSTCHPSGRSDSPNLENDAIQTRVEITNCIKQVEKNKQQQQNIEAKTKVQSYDRHSSSHHGLSQCSNDCDGENKLKKECQAVLKNITNSSEETVTVKDSQAATSDDRNFVELEGHVVAQPVIDPIWRGRFCLHNQHTGIVSGLLAHLSNLACFQVLEETRLLPEELSMDLLQRSMVWPNCFMKCGPNHDSIALYFFPENERAERDFDKLVDDIIHFDLAMRFVLEHAELLVFPSTLLPIKYRRFQAKYYLWGVFKAKQTSSNTCDAVCGEDKPLNPA